MNRRSGIESKRKIIEAAIKVFSECGYRAATIRMIAKEAKISPGGVYIYFKNKEDLYLFLVKEKIRELNELTSPVLKDKSHPYSALKEYMRRVMDFARMHKELIMIHSRELGFSFGIDLKREFIKKEKSMLVDLIKEGIKSGEFVDVDPEEAAKMITCLIRGYVFSFVVTPEDPPKSEECIRMVLRGLSRKKEGGDG